MSGDWDTDLAPGNALPGDFYLPRDRLRSEEAKADASSASLRPSGWLLLRFGDPSIPETQSIFLCSNTTFNLLPERLELAAAIDLNGSDREGRTG
jgi:hypothetical protein